MFSLKESIFGKKVEEAKEIEVEPVEVGIEEEPEEEGKESSREELMEEIQEALEDMSDDELDVVLDMLYSILLQDEEGEELEEGFIDHMSSSEKSKMKMKRRLPKWKRKAKVRYFRNKKCPAGTSWSSVTKSCTHINIDMSRLQKIISKMKIRSN